MLVHELFIAAEIGKSIPTVGAGYPLAAARIS
jgi:hypothetical protein